MNISEIALVPIVNGLVEMAKNMGLPKKYAAPAALALGILLQLGVAGTLGFSLDAVLQGAVIGLSASGLYSGSKAILKKKPRT